jgi:hypothetical protein
MEPNYEGNMMNSRYDEQQIKHLLFRMLKTTYLKLLCQKILPKMLIKKKCQKNHFYPIEQK